MNFNSDDVYTLNTKLMFFLLIWLLNFLFWNMVIVQDWQGGLEQFCNVEGMERVVVLKTVLINKLINS